MEAAAEYMDYLMIQARLYLLLPGMYPARRARDFEVHGLAWHEVFRPKVVNRPGGTRDWLFMQFHSPAQILSAGELREQPANTFVLWEPSAPHRYGNPRSLWSHSWLMCDGPGLSAAVRGAGLPLNRPIHMDDTSIVDELLPALHAELAANRQPDKVILENLVAIWVRRLARHVGGSAAPAVPPRILAARALLEQRFPEPLALERLAAFAGLSVSHFACEFRKFVGVPPMRYLLERRLKHAAYLLADVNATVAEVARAVGFRDPLYFSRQFRRRFGLSPRPYRQARQGPVPAGRA
jgi:AraC family transcriptional regulator of arabinose operon